MNRLSSCLIALAAVAGAIPAWSSEQPALTASVEQVVVECAPGSVHDENIVLLHLRLRVRNRGSEDAIYLNESRVSGLEVSASLEDLALGKHQLALDYDYFYSDAELAALSATTDEALPRYLSKLAPGDSLTLRRDASFPVSAAVPGRLRNGTHVASVWLADLPVVGRAAAQVASRYRSHGRLWTEAIRTDGFEFTFTCESGAR